MPSSVEMSEYVLVLFDSESEAGLFLRFVTKHAAVDVGVLCC